MPQTASTTAVPMPAADEKKLTWLQALRGVAALMVVFFHMKPYWEWAPLLRPGAPWMHWGFSGVDVFFVISGFVVYRSAKASIPAHGVFSFWRKRAARIYLVYWPVFLIFAAVSIFVVHSPPKSAAQAIRSFFLLQPTIFEHWMAVAWSLTHELYYYLWLGLVFLLPRRARTPALLALAAVIVAWNAARLHLDPEQAMALRQPPSSFWLNAMALEFLAGVFLSMAHEAWARRAAASGGPKPPPRRAAAAFAALGAALTATGFYLGSLSETHNHVALLRAGTYGLAGLGMVIVALALELTPFRPGRLMVLLGDSSYSIYLVHTLVMGLFGMLIHAHFEHRPAWLAAGLVAMPVLIAAVGCLWYLLVEIHLVRLARKA